MNRFRQGLTASLGVVALLAGGSLTAAAATATAAASDAIHWNFEDGTLQGWTPQPGSIFGPLITNRAFFHNSPTVPYNKEGTYFLSTLEDPNGNPNDAYTGIINSPTFTLTHPTVSMLVGGGNSAQTYVAACVADPTQPYGCQVVGKAQGAAAETMQYRTMDLSAFVGKALFLQVVDESLGAWGHVTLDDVRVNYPTPPQNVQTARTDKAVTVTWDAVKDTGLAGYYVYRSTNENTGYTRLTPTPITATTYTDSTADPATDYFYRVSAAFPDGTESGASATAYSRAYQNVLGQGSTVTYAGDKLSGIEFPVGPISAGGILHFGDGTRNESWIFNHDDNFQGRTTGAVPNSFFAVRAAPEGGTPVVRALQTKAQGAFPATDALTFQGEYPLAHYNFQDKALPVQVSQDVTNPTVPGDLKNSSIPTAMYTFTIKNPSTKPVSVSLLATQQNAVGFDGVGAIGGANNDSFPGYLANTNTVSTSPSQGRLLMSGVPDTFGNPGAVDPNRTAPKLALSMQAPNVTGTASWTGSDGLYSDFAAHGSLTGPATAASPAPGTTVDGALASTVSLAPGAEVKIPVQLSWNFPNNPRRGFGQAEGEQYTNWWPDATSVDDYAVSNRDSLLAKTALFHDTVYKSNLPHYMIDRITSGIAVLHTPTVFWGKNGFNGGWEGYGCCWGMPNHVWHYAQTASALWPQIGQMWAQQWLNAEQPDGLLPYRYNGDTPIDPQNFGAAFDGQAGVILSAYRTYEQTGDTAWLKQYWPKIQKAMDYLINQHDPSKNGLLTGAQATTLDSSESGTGSWLGSMYLVAVNATAHMATAAADPATATGYQTLYNTGRANQEKLLWNGSYYVEKPENLPGTVAYGPGSEIDMLLGQWWSGQLGLGDIYDTTHMNTAAASLFNNNYRSNYVGFSHVWRTFLEPTDAGMQMITWPNGGKPPNATSYFDESMTGFEYSAAAMMIQRGQVTDGLTEVQALANRHDGKLRTDLTLGGCGAGDGAGNPFGDVECGQWYSRSMSSWSLLTALQGGTYNGADQSIGFAPQFQPENHQSFFTAGTSYGTFSQNRDGTHTQTDTIQVASGSLALRQVHLSVPAGRVLSIHVSLGQQQIKANYTVTGSDVTLNIPATTIPAGATLSVTADANAPAVTSVSPNAGPIGGGNTVTIAGSGFTGASAVTFGGTNATTYVVNSDTSITAVAPAHAAGAVDVLVTGPGGTSLANTGDTYTYGGTPTNNSPQFVAVTPNRVLDTRQPNQGVSGNGYTSGPLQADKVYTFDLKAHGVPATATAAALNVTSIQPSRTGYLGVAGDGGATAAQNASLVNHLPGKDTANAVVVAIDTSNGVLTLFSRAANTDVAIDLTGYYTTVSAYNSAGVTRVADTRTSGGPIPAGTFRAFTVNTPAGSKAVALNVTSVHQSGGGYLAVVPHGAPAPKSSNVNYLPGVDKAGFAIVNLPTDGSNMVDVYAVGGDDNVVLDEFGYYPTTANLASLASPKRVLDTRDPANNQSLPSPLMAGKQYNFSVTGAGVPTDAQAVVISLTSAHNAASTGVGNLAVYPAGDTQPLVSTLNYISPGRDVANLAIVKLGPNGTLTLLSSGSPIDVAVDVLGYVPAGS